MGNLNQAKYSCWMCIFLLIAGCSNPSTISDEIRLGPHLGMEPTDTPRLLAPKLIATPLTEYNGTFSRMEQNFSTQRVRRG